MKEALQHLRQLDPVIMPALIERVGQPSLRRRRPDFAGLAAIVVAQQVSTASAAAIFGRLETVLSPLTAEAVLRATEQDLRSAGLSANKIQTLRNLAQAITSQTLELEALASLPAEEARNRLIALPGIGPWTADVYLLFCLGHGDAWPSGDLALQEAVRLVLQFEARPGAAEMDRIGARWRPHRGAAAYLLWAYYRVCAPMRRKNVGVPEPA